MKRVMILIGLGVLCMAQNLPQTSCPNLSPDGDQDRDGIPNGQDACCFVMSLPGQGSLSGCGLTTDPLEDLNDDTVVRKDEGLCCVWEEPNLCAKQGDGSLCPAGGIVAPCDRLFVYDHAKVDEQTEMDSVECGDGVSTECLCFTIGDFDGDGDGPADNCPMTPNNSDENEDDDHWGDACDPCFDEDPPSLMTCDPSVGAMGNDSCGPGSFCVPAIIGASELNYVCSSPPDRDGNGFPDACDPCAYQDPSPGSPVFVGEIEDEDSDGIPDVCDNCVGFPNPSQEDLDSDGIGFGCDPCYREDPVDADTAGDEDSDSVDDLCDNCLGRANSAQGDMDHDGIGDSCDNCLHIPNRYQENSDSDLLGDACDMCPEQYDSDTNLMDGDMDGDGVADSCDMCPGNMDTKAHVDMADDDGDGVGNACDQCPGLDDLLFNIFNRRDRDHDGVNDDCDICPNLPYEEAILGHDENGDGIWDECLQLLEVDTETSPSDDPPGVEADADEDGILDADDNCPEDANPDQADRDADGLGDVCSPVNDYTGAFNCRCEAVGAGVGQTPTLLGLLYYLI